MSLAPKDNANTGLPGKIGGINNKKQGHTNMKKKASPMASSNSFGQASTIAPGKKNFSRGAPGHQSSPAMKTGRPAPLDSPKTY